MVVALLVRPDITEIDLDVLDEIVPDAGTGMKGARSSRIFKDHRPSFDLFPKIIYNVRDGRDSIVSAFHYAVKSLGFKGSFDDYIFSREAQLFGFWHEHVQQAIQFGELYPSRILFVKYEDLSVEFERAVIKIASFLGVEASQKRIELIRKKTDFKLQQVKASKSSNMKKRHTIRTGMVSGYKGLLEGRNLEVFEQISAKELTRFGY